MNDKDKMYILNDILCEVKPLYLRQRVGARFIEFVDNKIPGGSVVLSKEEWEEIKIYKSYIPELKKAFDKIRNQAVKEVLGKLKEEIEQAIKSNYKVIKEEESSTIIYQWCKGKIDALRGIDNYIDEIAKEYGVEVEE